LTTLDEIPVTVFAGIDIATVDDAVAAVQRAADEGFAGIWMPQHDTVDTLTALAVAGHRVRGVAVGTAVIPIQARHPYALAQQALTVASAAGPGRFTLGIGVSHPPVSENRYGVPYEEVVSRCQEVLEALDGFFSTDRTAKVAGTYISTRATIALQTDRPGLVVAALGPRMLQLAGRFADGTVTWMAGPRTLRERLVPTISEAAEAAGRPEPRVIVGVSVCITEQRAEARERFRPLLTQLASMPSYHHLLAEEGIDDPVDTVLVGSGAEVLDGLTKLAAAGATEILADPMGSPEEQSRTRSVLAQLR
jgi:F420-dependent oxidoreductase-like protein